MLFSSMTFLYLFLPIVCILYLLVKKELRNPLLLIASILFYAWGEPKYLAIMLLTIIVNYIGAIIIEKQCENKIFKKLTLLITLLINFGFLVYFKYFDFIIQNINTIFHSNIDLIKVIMPIGISFYTFQAVSYVIDVYRKDCEAQKDIYKLALFICLFPQLVAGPIIKYHDIKDQIDDREVNFEKVILGVKRFIIGLSKKVLIANTMGSIADSIYSQPADTFSPCIAWLGSIAYSLQLFFDFSGYSDMAIGLGLIFGFKFLENFNYPYISKSITEFWRRWHISLSTWFKQYLYIPLGGSRGTPFKTYRNLFIVFLVTGIWHGAAWNFIAWGIYNGMFIIMEKMTGFHKDIENKWINVLKHTYCIFVFIIGWTLFRAENMSYAWAYIKNMFGLLKLNEITYNFDYYNIDKPEIVIFIVAILCSMPIFKNMLYVKNKIGKIVINCWLIILLIVSTTFIASSTYNPFIYFRF